MNLNEAKQLAELLMVKHGITQQGWRFEFDNARSRFGCCKYRTKRITLSKHLTELNGADKIKDTILHEIAHALTQGHKHNHIWRRKALEIGCNGERCYSSKTVNTPDSKYIAVCPNCNHVHKRHRASKLSWSCSRCSGGRYNPTFKLNFIINPNF